VALSEAPRVLVLRALGLGDLLTAVPALRAVRRRFPAHEVVLATPAELAPLLGLAGVVDDVLDTRDLTRLAWPHPPPCVAVNLHGRGPQSHRLLEATRPLRLVAFDSPEAGHAGPAWCQDEHEVRRWCRLVTEEIGVVADAADLLLPAPCVPPIAPGAVVVHPGAAFESRRWPVERFAAVARWAAGEGLTTVVTGAAVEAGLAEDVCRLAGLPTSANLAGRTDVLQLAALVSGARLLVCGDTGIAHLATAFATPSVVLFGPTPPDRWGPVTDGPHTVLWHGGDLGDPWGEDVDPALLRIEVDEVLTEAATLLGR
jgi:ADP-heptose:LPS heptosyltransferase